MKQTVNLPAVMRDQVVLRYDLYSPDEGGAYPVILQRTPYGKQFVSNDPIFSDFERYTKEGYHVAVMDCRGTGESDGILRCNGDNEYLDGYDSVEWIAAQTFCNGHVGMCGLSYNGFDQMAAAMAPRTYQQLIAPTSHLASMVTHRVKIIHCCVLHTIEPARCMEHSTIEF